MTNKQCSKCKLIKNLSEFGLNSRGRDGLQPRCKVCYRDHQRNLRKQARQTPAANADPDAARYKDSHGYIWVRHGPGWVLEHRLIMGVLEQPNLHVYHTNKDRADNRPENLEVLPASAHLSRPRGPGVKKSLARLREDGAILCLGCKQHHPPEAFYSNPSSAVGVGGRCKLCIKKQRN